MCQQQLDHDLGVGEGIGVEAIATDHGVLEELVAPYEICLLYTSDAADEN